MYKKLFVSLFAASVFCAAAFAQTPPPPPQRAQNPPPPNRPFENFRGRRKPVRQGKCRLDYITSSPLAENGNEYLALDLFFTQSIDPRSVRGQNILVNSSALSEEQKILFNKSATCMRILVKNQHSFSLTIDGIRAYNAEPVPRAHIEFTEYGRTYFFNKEEAEWKKF